MLWFDLQTTQHPISTLRYPVATAYVYCLTVPCPNELSIDNRPPNKTINKNEARVVLEVAENIVKLFKQNAVNVFFLF